MKTKNGRGMRRRWCPFCEAVVLCDDATLSLHHAAPVCDAFDALAKSRGGWRAPGEVRIVSPGDKPN